MSNIARADALSLPIADESIHAVICDPPYGIGFGGSAWDSFPRDRLTGNVRPFANNSRESLQQGQPFQAWCQQWATEALRVLKPGGWLAAFGATRAYHRLACGIEDAGFEMRDCVLAGWAYACLSEDTEILVDGQWEHFSKAIAGRRALCYNSIDGTFTWTPIQTSWSYWHDDTAIRIHSTETDQLVTRNHRCIVEREGVCEFKVAEDIAREREARIPVLEDLQGLLRHLCLQHERTGDTEQDMWEELPGKGLGTTPHGCDQAAQIAGWDAADRLRSLQCRSMAPSCLDEESRPSNLFQEMQRQTSREGIRETTRNTGGLDSRKLEILPSEDDRGRQSGMEGRSNILQEAWQLQIDQICSLPTDLLTNGEKGRIRNGASLTGGEGDRSPPITSGDCSPRRSRSREQRAIEPIAVCQQPSTQAIRASPFTTTTLARFEFVSYRGVVWCVTVPTGAFVARRKGKAFITGNSGFPKSHDVSKAIDRHLGAERTKVRIPAKEACNPSAPGRGQKNYSVNQRPWIWEAQERGYYEAWSDEPATPEAAAWKGWGTALRPSWEPIVLARKPLAGTVAATVLQHGTGAMHIDAARMPAGDDYTAKCRSAAGLASSRTKNCYGDFGDAPRENSENPLGRWPPNLITDGPLFGPRHSRYFDISRIFLTAKAAKRERCEFNEHPTVKPLNVIRWLVRLLVPPGGIVLDPFAGSGTTAIATRLEGRHCVACDREWKYLVIARGRLAGADELDEETGMPAFNQARLPGFGG